MNKKMTHEQMSVAERIARIAFGAAMISSMFSAEIGPLGWLAVLPLAAVYPLLTGITGTDPVRGVLTSPTGYRLFAGGAAAALVGVALALPAVAPSATLGTLAVLPLAGIYAVLAALLGRAPMAAVTEAMRTIVYIVPPAADEDVAVAAPLQHKVRSAA